jgi:formylglycine-generating enzyme required for sulfatase activity
VISDDAAEPPSETDTLAESSGGTTKVGTMEIIRIMERAARAIHAAHEAGVIHRDLKPGNIMVDAAGDPVVLDFGLARDLEGDGVSITKSGDFLGTPAYMSPEQIASGHIHLDRRSDVYSLGVTLYECLTLKRPFDAPTREGLYQAILSKEPPDPRRINKSISSDLKVVIETALNKDRDRRYVSAEAFANDLKRVRELKPIQAKPISPIGRLVRWGRRNPLVAVMTAAAFLSLAIGLVATLMQWLRAEKALVRAEESAAIATAKTLDWERLADGRVLDGLMKKADASLWPATPDRVPALEAWLKDAGKLADRLAAHRAALAAARAQAQPYDDEARKRDRESCGAESERLSGLGPEIEAQRKVVAAPEGPGAPTPEQRKSAEKSLAALEEEKKNLEAKVSQRMTWEFDSPAEQLKHDQLAILVRDLDLFLGDARGEHPTRKDVAARLEFARNLKRRSIDDYAAAWRETISQIARSPHYGGLRIKEQLGLVPLGPDPVTGLFEFAELQTGEPPVRDAGAAIGASPDQGIVFVLIPGGTFLMGAQRTEPEKPNYDPDARNDEYPPNEVTLGAFFLSKFEMTQGQWMRFTGKNPSLSVPGKKYRTATKAGTIQNILLSDPVEQVSWDDCTKALGRLGLVLPTEAQWEYAARAGTRTPWWCGDDKGELQKFANVADHSFAANGGTNAFEDWDDGYATHTQVGNFPANRFGLHGVIGNVWEWCRDGKVSYTVPVQPGDGLRIALDPKTRVVRGGSFAFNAANARSAFRNEQAPTGRIGNIGVRPARAIQE